ncbi:DUF3575 domain-containing protein [Empedobacter tilapiae]|uniref:DUF3575 domain-containing protein n=1 Tax=Empedobacter tilapiae TaxID=2491114 RepID=A0A4Z1BG13_9FLAO|nr:DUF3575 domain-containing protein [Empedobacter tilapiae]TGN27844.1 DUF3575 domain-containing protein [Empedobacter tilapiae]
MKKILLTCIGLVTLMTAKAQQIEFGPTIGYRFNNIVDRKAETKRAVIGNALWKTEYGFQAVYNFRKPGNEMNYRLTAFYQNQQRGSKSERFSDERFEIDTNGFGLMFGIAREVSPKWILTLNIGLGTNSMDTKKYYKGDHLQTEAFDKLYTELEPKSNEVNFLYQIGVERVLIPNKLLAFVDFHGDAGISKMNSSIGSYGNQGLGFGAGLRYLVDLSRKD